MGGRSWSRKYPNYEAFITDVYGPYLRTFQAAGSRGVMLLEAAEPAGDFSDAPLPELILAYQNQTSATGLIDLGAGKFKAPQGAEFTLTAPHSGASVWMDDPHVVRAVAIPYLQLKLLADRDGVVLPLDGDFGRLHAKPVAEPRVRQLCDSLFDEIEQGSPLGPLFVDGCLLQIAALLLHEKNRTACGVSKGQLALWQTKRVLEYMQANMAKDFSLDDVAAVVHLSPFHFCRAFKATLGIPPHTWLTGLRMEAAKNLMRQGLPIAQAASAVGYSSQASFANAFKRMQGVSPGHWRQLAREAR